MLHDFLVVEELKFTSSAAVQPSRREAPRSPVLRNDFDGPRNRLTARPHPPNPLPGRMLNCPRTLTGSGSGPDQNQLDTTSPDHGGQGTPPRP
jgi:hypothetical protein